MTDRQDSRQDDPPELVDLLRFTTTCLGLGIPVPKVAGDFRFGLEGLRQRGILSLEDVARIRAVTAGEATDHPEEWAAGFAEGYRSAWAAAVLRVLDTRGIAFDKHLHRGLNLCLHTDRLTRFLDRAVSAAHEADLVVGEPIRPSPDGS